MSFISIAFSYASRNLNIVMAEDLQEDAGFVSEIRIGKKDAETQISLYVSPSCLHCGQLIADDLEKFMEDNKDEVGVVIKFLPTSAKDFFIMKLINNESRDENGFFLIYKNYIKRILATINKIDPTEDQIEKFKGSNTDSEMIKFQVGAYDFGFSEEKIIKAIPEMKEQFERGLVRKYSEISKDLIRILDSKEINLPLIVRNNKVYKSLKDARNSN